MLSRVLIIDATYRTIAQQVDAVLGEFPVDVAGKKVLVKPNVLTAYEPEAGANTHPALVRAVAEALEARGAAKVWVADNPGQLNYGQQRFVFERCGLMDAVGARYRNLGVDLVPVRIPSLEEPLYVSRLLLEADVVVNLPKLKTHKLTGLTGAIKNCFGYLPGALKARVHVLAHTRAKFERCVAEVFGLKPPVISIVDGILAMQGYGASSRSLKYLGKLLVAYDSVALDAVIARAIRLPLERLIHVQAAAELGYGTADLSRIQVEGQLMSTEESFELPPGFVPEGTPWELAITPGIVRDVEEVDPWVDPSRCDRCGECVRQCPQGVLVAKEGSGEGYPRHVGGCVGCYACQEACARDAIRVRRRRWASRPGSG